MNKLMDEKQCDIGDSRHIAEEYSPSKVLGTPLTLLDANAGTGKTYSICDRIVREIIAGNYLISDMVIITFTNAAARELKTRIRTFLANPLEHNDNNVLTADQEKRVQHALDHLASASIGTIHHFCTELLSLVGNYGNFDPGRVLSNDATYKLRTLIQTSLREQRLPGFNEQFYSDAISANSMTSPQLKYQIREVCSHLDAGHEAYADESERVRLTKYWGSEFAEQLTLAQRALSIMDNDSLLQLARDQVRESAAVVDLVRRYWKLVVVDEFQDTDPIQWQMIYKAFIEGESPTKVLVVGDPKQSIYAFRGADLHNYAEALDLSEQGDNKHYVLTTNYRSDERVINAVNNLIVPNMKLQMFDAEYEFRAQSSNAAQATQSSLKKQRQLLIGDNAPDEAGIYLRALENVDKKEISGHVFADVVLYTKQLLDDMQLRASNDQEKQSIISEAGTPIAVLVNQGTEANKLLALYRKAGIHAVYVHSDSVWGSAAAQSWLYVLQAVLNPSSQSEVTKAELSLLGCSSNWQELDLSSAFERWFRLSKIFTQEGFKAFWTELYTQHKLATKLLSKMGGEGDLTDVNHISELLQQAFVTNNNPQALLDWLSAQIAPPTILEKVQSADEERRRVSNESPDVQIMTIHGSKGLQFPIVLLPTLYDETIKGAKSKYLLYTKRVASDKSCAEDQADLVRDEELTSAQNDQAHTQSEPKLYYFDKVPDTITKQRLDAAFYESGRTTYVALTRATLLNVVWQPLAYPERKPRGGYSPWRSALNENKGGNIPEDTIKTNINDGLGNLYSVAIDFVDNSESITEYLNSNGWILNDSADQNKSLVREMECIDVQDDYRLSTQYIRRMSFSSLASHESSPILLGQEDETISGVDDEPTQFAENEVDEGYDILPIPSDTEFEAPLNPEAYPMAHMEAGIYFGTAVHQAFENLINERHAQALRGISADKQNFEMQIQDASRFIFESEEQDHDLARVLSNVFNTPLPGCFNNARLIDFEPQNLRAELEFDFNVRSDKQHKTIRSFKKALAEKWGELIVEGLIANDDPANCYVAKLHADAERGVVQSDTEQEDQKVFEPMDGVLNGFIDLLARDVEGRYFLIDWKTNRVAPYGHNVSYQHFTPLSLAQEMAHADYFLQMIIYSVALLRLVKDPNLLGGAGWLFVRGIGNPADPATRTNEDGTPLGAFTWKPPIQLIEYANQLLYALEDGDN